MKEQLIEKINNSQEKFQLQVLGMGKAELVCNAEKIALRNQVYHSRLA